MPHMAKMSLPPLDVGAEYLFVIVKAVTTLLGQKQCGHFLDGELTMWLLEYCTHIDQRVDILAVGRVFLDGRFLITHKKIAQLTDCGVCGGRIACSGKGEDPETSIRFDNMAEVNRLDVPACLPSQNLILAAS